MLDAFESLKCLFYDMSSGLCKYLNHNIVRNQVVLDQSADEFIFRIGGGREADLDFLESDATQEFEHVQFFLQRHGLDQSLIAVP